LVTECVLLSDETEGDNIVGSGDKSTEESDEIDDGDVMEGEDDLCDA
jgi:hypothetical protein